MILRLVAVLSFVLAVLPAFARPQAAAVKVVGPGAASAPRPRPGVRATLVVTENPKARVEVRDSEEREDVIVIAWAGGEPLGRREGRTLGGLDNTFECDWPEAGPADRFEVEFPRDDSRVEGKVFRPPTDGTVPPPIRLEAVGGWIWNERDSGQEPAAVTGGRLSINIGKGFWVEASAESSAGRQERIEEETVPGKTVFVPGPAARPSPSPNPGPNPNPNPNPGPGPGPNPNPNPNPGPGPNPNPNPSPNPNPNPTPTPNPNPGSGPSPGQPSGSTVKTASTTREVGHRDYVRTNTYLAGVRYDAVKVGRFTVFAAADAGVSHRRFEQRDTEFDPVAEARAGVELRLSDAAHLSLELRGRESRSLDARGNHEWQGAISPTIGIHIGF